MAKKIMKVEGVTEEERITQELISHLEIMYGGDYDVINGNFKNGDTTYHYISVVEWANKRPFFVNLLGNMLPFSILENSLVTILAIDTSVEQGLGSKVHYGDSDLQKFFYVESSYNNMIPSKLIERLNELNLTQAKYNHNYNEKSSPNRNYGNLRTSLVSA